MTGLPLLLTLAAGAPGPTSAAVGLPVILVLVAVLVIGTIVYVIIRRR